MEHDPGENVLLDLIGEIMGALDLHDFRATLMAALPQAVPADWVSITELGPDRVVVLLEPKLSDEHFETFTRFADENPLYQRWVRTHDSRAYRFSDVVTREELEANRLWQEFYGPLGINHQIAFTLPNDPTHALAVVLSRSDRDFSDGERDFLNRARPFLVQAFRNALAHEARSAAAPGDLGPALEEAGLTTREAAVMELIALGRSNADAAQQLGISERTVEKHLERVFEKLGERSRSAASARAWELAGAYGTQRKGEPPGWFKART
jgi:DNA-binding CsgD family transcriptional regulator